MERVQLNCYGCRRTDVEDLVKHRIGLSCCECLLCVCAHFYSKKLSEGDERG